MGMHNNILHVFCAFLPISPLNQIGQLPVTQSAVLSLIYVYIVDLQPR